MGSGEDSSMRIMVIKSRRLSSEGHVAEWEKIITGKPAEKIVLGRLMCRWEDNIKIYVKEIGISTRNWVDSAQDRDYWGALQNAALNLRVP